MTLSDAIATCCKLGGECAGLSIQHVPAGQKVRADAEDASPSTRSAAVRSRNQKLEFGNEYAWDMETSLCLVRIASNGEPQPRCSDAHSSRLLTVGAGFY